MPNLIPQFNPFRNDQLKALCAALGATDGGLTGTEIGKCLQTCRVDNIAPDDTKRFRLYKALQARQEQDGSAVNFLSFIMSAMELERFHDVLKREEFKRRVNLVLAPADYQIEENGIFSRVK